jgi:hypothetical protein
MGWIVKDSVHMYGGEISMRDSCSQHAHIYVYTGAESESDDGFYDFAGDSAAAPVKRKQTAEAEKAYERGKVKSDVLLIGLACCLYQHAHGIYLWDSRLQCDPRG